MSRDASELARRLAHDAEAVCRHYLSNGRRQGRYWTVGDVRNTPGRSMFVRLSGPESGRGAAGHWTDAASAEYGDLLDVIRESCGLTDFRDVADEARRFLSLPRAEAHCSPRLVRAPGGSPEAAASRSTAASATESASGAAFGERRHGSPRDRNAVESAKLGPLHPMFGYPSRHASRRRRNAGSFSMFSGPGGRRCHRSARAEIISSLGPHSIATMEQSFSDGEAL